MSALRACGWLAAACLACGVAAAQSGASDTDESAYTPSTLAKIMGGAARSQNDEAELAPPGQWFTTTATFTGQKRQPSSRFRPLISSWVGSRGQPGDLVDMFFGGDLPELQFEQAGKKYWVMAGLPGGLGFDVYPPGQKLSIYLQRVGFASGTPVAVLTLAKLPTGVTSTTVARGPPHAQHAHGRGRAPPGSHVQERLGHLHLRRPRIFTATRCGGPPFRDARAVFVRERRAHRAARVRLGRRSVPAAARAGR